MSARAVALGPGAERALREGRPGAVAVAFGPGGYVSLGDRFVLLAPPRSPPGPLSLLVAGLPDAGLEPAAPARSDGHRLEVGGLSIGLAGARRFRPVSPGPLRRGWEAALRAALAAAPRPPAVIEAGLTALAEGDLRQGTALLAGLGEGLTPAGDDVLAGHAAWRWAQGAPEAADDGRCSPLGREYLRCAALGELPAPAARVLAAVRAADAPAAVRRAGGLRAWGASSGAALLWGMGAAGAADAAGRRGPAPRPGPAGPPARARAPTRG